MSKRKTVLEFSEVVEDIIEELDFALSPEYDQGIRNISLSDKLKIVENIYIGMIMKKSLEAI
jgi:hypothetical protein